MSTNSFQQPESASTALKLELGKHGLEVTRSCPWLCSEHLHAKSSVHMLQMMRGLKFLNAGQQGSVLIKCFCAKSKQAI